MYEVIGTPPQLAFESSRQIARELIYRDQHQRWHRAASDSMLLPVRYMCGRLSHAFSLSSRHRYGPPRPYAGEANSLAALGIAVRHEAHWMPGRACRISTLSP